MSIVGTLPTTIKNGDAEDANVVMALFQFIQSQVNANACPATTGSSVLKGDGAGGTTPATLGADYVSGAFLGFRNRLRNGAFTVNQRAVSGTVTLAAGAYGHDGWKAGASGCTYTFATVGNVTVITITSGSLLQIVEGVLVEGGSYVLANQGTAQARVAINGGTTSGAYATASSASPLAVSSANANQTITVEFTTGTLDRVQLEPGTAVTTFERRLPALERVFCQLYYEIVRVHLIGSGYAVGAYVGARVGCKVTKRQALTVGSASLISSTNFNGPTTSNPTAEGFSIFGTAAAVGVLVEYIADVPVSAEL